MSDSSALFKMLAGDPRRRLLLMLCETPSVPVPDGLIDRGESAVRTTGQEYQQTVGARPSGSSSLEVSLHHNHLPQLVDLGYIEWDAEAGVVSRGDAFEDIEPALRVLLENADALPPDFFALH